MASHGRMGHPTGLSGGGVGFREESLRVGSAHGGQGSENPKDTKTRCVPNARKTLMRSTNSNGGTVIARWPLEKAGWHPRTPRGSWAREAVLARNGKRVEFSIKSETLNTVEELQERITQEQGILCNLCCCPFRCLFFHGWPCG